MATIAELNILLKLQDQTEKGLEKTKRNFQQWGQSLQKVGGVMTAAITAPVIAGAAAMVRAASDQREAMASVGEVYGSAADVVIQRAEAAAAAVGLSTEEYLSNATVLGVYGNVLGTTAAETADFSDSLITAAADLGSFYNANTPEVLSAMQAALRGEFDPLERFGIMMNMASLEQYALEQGIWDGNGALTNQQRILAAHGFIMDNMADATGDFARTSDGLANSQKILRAQIKNLAAQMGQVLLPTVQKMVAVARELVTRFQGIPESWQRWIVLIALAVAAIGPFLIALGTILTVLPAIGAALAVLTGPIGLVIAAIALLTAAYIGNWWGFRDAVNGVAGAVVDLINWLGEIDIVRSTVTSAIDSFVGSFNRIIGAVEKVGKALLEGDWRTALAGIGDLLAVPYKHIGDFIKGIETGFAPIDALLTDVGNMFTDFGRIIQEIFQGDFSGAIDVFQRAIGRIPEIVVGAFTAIPWTTIMQAVSDALAALPTVLNTVGALLYDKGRELIGGVLNGISAVLPAMTLLLSVIGTLAIEAVGDLTSTLLSKGKQLIGGVMSGVSAVLPFLTTQLGNIGTNAITAVGDLTETLLQAGKDLVAGIVSGFATRWASMAVSLGQLGATAARAVGDLSSALWNAGWNLIEGMIQGMISRIPYLEQVAERIAGIVGGVIELVNKITSPSRYMMELGGYMTEGLALGIERGIPQVTSAANAMAAAAGIDGGFGSGDSYGGHAGGGFTNYGIYQEADRYWAPEQTLRSRALQRNRR